MADSTDPTSRTQLDRRTAQAYMPRGPLVFINYRTADTGAAASSLARAIKRELDPRQVFIDYIGIDGGVPWRTDLHSRLAATKVLLVLIGSDWVNARDPHSGERRIDQPDDWVRREIEYALQHERKIVPVLVDDALPLSADELPGSIRPIADLQLRRLRTATAFESDVRALVTLLQAEGFERQRHPWTVSPDAVFNRLELHRFVGREWLTERLDAFIREQRSGYFVIEAQSGMGKTAFLARLVETRGYISHFVELQPGAAGLVPGLRNIASQIIREFGLEESWIDDLLSNVGTRDDFLERLLVVAASRRRDLDRPVVIIIDGLDAAGTPDGQNALGLPRHLPDQFFIVVSQRPVDVRLHTDAPRTIVSIEPRDARNLNDIAEYIRHALPDSDHAGPAIVERSEGNWVYAYHVCREIRSGQRDAGDADGLPRGLWQYYAQSWMSWRDAHAPEWPTTHVPVLATLSAAQEPLTRAALADLSGVTDVGLQRLLKVDWKPFLTTTLEAEGEHFQLYHASLRDFVGGDVDLHGLTSAELAFAEELCDATRERHAAIAGGALRRWGAPTLDNLRHESVEQERTTYEWRHVAKHLALAGERAALEGLLRSEWRISEEIPNPFPGWRGRLVQWARRRSGQTHLIIPRNAWFESHARAGDLAKFLDDWRSASKSPAGAPKRDSHTPTAHDIVFDIDSFLVRSSVHEAASRVPPGLVLALVRAGRWSRQQAIAYTREVADGAARAELLAELLSAVDVDRLAVLHEATTSIESLEHAPDRVRAFARLVGACRDDERESILELALEHFCTLESETVVETAHYIAPYLGAAQWPRFLAQINGLRTPLQRLRALDASAAVVSDRSPLEPGIARAMKDSLEVAGASDAAERSLALAVVAACSSGDAALSYADAALDAVREATGAPDWELPEQPYEALALLLARFPQRVPEDLVARSVEWLLSIRQPREPTSIERSIFPAIGVVTTEAHRTKLAGRLIAVAPEKTIKRIGKAVLRTPVRFQDWYAYYHLARRYAELGDGKRALQLAWRIERSSDRDRLIAGIAPMLDVAGVELALDLLDRDRARLVRRKRYSDNRHMEIELAEYGLTALVGLLPRLAALGRASDAMLRLRQTRAARHSAKVGDLISNLAPQLPAAALDELLRASMTFRDLDEFVGTLGELAAFLPSDKLDPLAGAAQRIGFSLNTVERLSWTRAVRSTSGVSHIEFRLAAAEAVAWGLARAGRYVDALREIARVLLYANQERTLVDLTDCLGDLAAMVPREDAAKVLRVAAQHGDQQRPRALQAIAPSLPADLLTDALVVARSPDEAGCRAWGVAALLPLANEPECLALAREAMNDLAEPFWDRARVLGLLGAYVDEALDEIRSDVSERSKHGLTSLRHLLPRANEAVSAEMIACAREAYDAGQLLELSSALPEALFRELLAHVISREPDALAKDERRAAVSLRLLSLGETTNAFTMALEIRDRFIRARMTRRMAHALGDVSLQDLARLWMSGDWLSRPRTRHEAFGFAAALSPLVNAFGGETAVVELHDAIQRAGRWWL